MKQKFIKIIVFLSFFIVFISFISNFLSVKLWDYDFWWHLATGKYIVENKVIPDKDPFSSVNNLEENKNTSPEREKYVLKQYWLSQVIFYKIYKVFGDKGIIIFRSFILFTAIFLVYWWLKRQGVSFYIIFPSVFAVFYGILGVIGERPVLFTILFVLLVFFILDDFKKRGGKLIFLLIPLMLLWANLHGGFLLGAVMIIAYLIGETANLIFKRTEISKRQLALFFVAGVLAISVSTITPTGVKVLLQFSQESTIFAEAVHEYYSPFTFYFNNISPIDWEYILLIIFFLVVTIARNKKIDVVYYLLLFGLLGMSISAVRFVAFFVLIGVLILGRELHYLVNDILKRNEAYKTRFEYGVALLIFISSVIYAVGFLNFNTVTFGKATETTVPQGAADFIISHNIKGNMFNDIGSGGYLIWRLYPWKKVFIDTRNLNYTVLKEYEWIMNGKISLKNKELPEGKDPLWKRLLDHYDIDIIVVNTMDSVGTTPPLLFSLIKSEKWIPVYNDIMSIVFVRDNKDNRGIINQYRREEDDIYNSLITRLSTMALHIKNPIYMLSIGDTFYSMERYDDALKAYEYADRRNPNQANTQKRIYLTKQHLEKDIGNNIKREEL